MGQKRAAELLLLAERVDAAGALELGLINRVVPAQALDAETLKLAERLKAGPRHAYGEIKRLLNGASHASLTQQLMSEADAFARCSATMDFEEGIRGFVEKRKPDFRGK